MKKLTDEQKEVRLLHDLSNENIRLTRKHLKIFLNKRMEDHSYISNLIAYIQITLTPQIKHASNLMRTIGIQDSESDKYFNYLRELINVLKEQGRDNNKTLDEFYQKIKGDKK